MQSAIVKYVTNFLLLSLIKNAVGRDSSLKKYKFVVFKCISEILVMIIYFLITFFFMSRIDLFGHFDKSLQVKANFVIDLAYCVMLWGFLALLEALNVGRRRVLDLIFGFFFGSVCVNVIFAIVLSVFYTVSFGVVLIWIIAFVAIQVAIGVVWIILNQRVYESVQFRKEAIYIYGKKDLSGELERINSTINKYFNFSKSVDSSEGLDAILDEIALQSVVYLGDVPTNERNAILKYCMKHHIDCYSIPKISDIYIQNSRVMQLNDKLLLKYPPLEIDRTRAFLKRTLDIIVGTLMLIISSPFMLIIAVAIKLTDRGPVIYKQKRVTKDETEFTMYKFRSMKLDAEKDGARLACEGDDRVTGIGRIIRNIHFDELPQLINVLKGEMSLVGPRPERREFIEEYSRVIPEFKERLKVKGGLTGYAQVYGRYNTTPEDKVKYDLYYIYNYSLWMDIKILILTVRILFQKENTQGVEQGQRNALYMPGEDAQSGCDEEARPFEAKDEDASFERTVCRGEAFSREAGPT